MICEADPNGGLFHLDASNLTKIRSASLSTTGATRTQNDDNWFVADDHSLFVVADGVGGYPGGNVASSIVVDTLTEELVGGKVPSSSHVLPLVNWALIRANREVIQAGRTCPELASARSTVVLGLRVENELFVKSHGDSRAYQLHGGSLRRLTRDNTVTDFLVSVGSLVPGLTRTHPQRHILLTCLGQHDFDPRDDLTTVDLSVGDRVLFCSDGLNDSLDDCDIEWILAESRDPDEAVHGLTEAGIHAEDASGDDITCIVAFVG